MKDGFINVLKPPGMTSHDVVSFVRRRLQVKKAGHAGTLDPGAAGVLPVAVGRATRLLEYLDTVDKSYRAELCFGEETDSGDDLGEVIASRSDFSMPDEGVLEQVVRGFTGKIRQIPPVYSAVKIQGKRACDLARAHIPVALPEREVEIYRLVILARRENRLLLEVDCSKGTYIRSLCRDLGVALGLPAAMSFLVRQRVGSFLLSAAHALAELEAMGEAVIEPPENHLRHLPSYTLSPDRVIPFCNGLATRDAAYQGPKGRLTVYGPSGFLGAGHFDDESASIVPDKVYRPQSG